MTNPADRLPPGLERATLQILQRCKGARRAVGRRRMLSLIRQIPGLGNVDDRQMRGAIEELRGQGYLICNMSDGNGYFMAKTDAEYRDFRAKYGSYAFTMLEKIRRMDKAAKKEWGEFSPEKQGRMF